MAIGAHYNHGKRQSQSVTFQIIRYLSAALIVFGLLAAPSQGVAARPAAAPTPAVNVSVPAAPLIGETITINATFSNTVDTGYGPYMDIFLPLSGADGTSNGGSNDGISFLSASYLSAPVTTNVLNCPAGGSVTHPLTGLSVTCPAQPGGLFSPFVWQMVVITMPFGSFVPGQPDATVTISAQLSGYADLDTGLPIQVRAGFMFGADPLDNPGSDPVIASPITPVSPVPSPKLVTLSKTYSGPEDETATGPNYPREYTVTASIAPGQTVTSLTLTDELPNNMQFLTMVTPSNAACTTLPNTNIPGGTISCPVTQVGNTASMTFRYYIPLNSSVPAPVIHADSGDDVLSQNNALASGSWQPTDTRDPLTPVLVDPVGYEHVLTDKSIAIQKGVANVTDSVNSPGDLLRYTLNFQVSDFFAFNDISISDVLSDGQHFYSAPGYTPVMSINGNQYALGSAAIDTSNLVVSCNYTGGPGAECDVDDPAANNGTTHILFNVSDEIVRRNGDADGRMVGGCVPNGGVGAGNFPDCSLYNNAATTGTITFYAQIQENFTDDYPSGDSSVDQGDVLNNRVTVDGALLSVADASTPTGQREADGSSAEIRVPYGVITKSIHAINGNTSFSSPVSISPGDTVTYRVTYTLPTSDFEALVVSDYLPLPVFNATEVTSFIASVCGVPASGTSCYGPDDTYHSLPNTPPPVTPVLSTSAGSNTVIWSYGNYDADNNQPSKVDLLFTVTVNNNPFADGLFLTNQANTQENSTNADANTVDGIVQILLQEPMVYIKKGVVWTDKAGASFSPATAAPVTFNGGGCPAFSGTINSINLATTPIDSNLSGVDAGDTVKMAVVVENTGRNAAYDLLVSDLIPAGLNFNSGSVCVTDGAGNALAFTGAADNFVGSGITLTSLGRGKQSDGTLIGDGSNVAIITYDVTVAALAEATQAYTNTATLSNYAGVPGGPNHIPGGRTDDATVRLAPPAINKNFVSTEIDNAYNSSSQVVIGEFVTYRVTVTVPEGVTPNARIVDTLDAGLAFVDLLSAALSPGLSISGSTTPVITNNGQTVTLDLGTITNSNTNDSVAETITLEYRVVTLNVMGNQTGMLLNNWAALSWTGGNTTASAPNVTVIEPTVNTTKTVSAGPFDAGDTATFTVTLANPATGSTTAHDVSWNDTLPAGLTYVTGSLALGTCTAATPPGITFTAPNVLSGSGGLFQPGQSCQITFQVTIDYAARPGQTITNTAQTRWTSMAGVVSNRSSYNSSSNERDGSDGLLNGGTLNDYRTQGPRTITISSVALQKYLVATSEAHTTIVGGTEQVTIGEIVRYRLVVQIPEGTSTNFQILDRLPGGLTFLNDNTAKAIFVSNGTGTTSSAVGTLPVPAITDPDCFITGNSADAVTPTIPAACDALANNNIGSSNSTAVNVDNYATGADPYFKLGTLTNNDSDADAEYVIVEFNALVDNTSAGNNNAGNTRANDFQVFINGSQNNGTSPAITLRVAEPVVSIDKSIAGSPPVDAGDPLTYRMVITNLNQGTPTTAFDIVMTDTVDSNLTINSASVVATSQGAVCQGGTAFTHSVSTVGQLVTLNASCLDVSQSITVEIAATVNANAPASLTIPNTARTTWTSLPGSNGTTVNPTGSLTPGTPGSDSGERTGDNSGGRNWNDYAAQDSESVSLSNPLSVVKNAPTPLVYTIGQTVTYPIAVTLHEGTTRSLRVTDTFPQGLGYLSYSVDTTGFNGTVSTSPTVGTVGDPVSGPSTTTFTFGDTIVNATPGSGTSAFTINVTARVLDIPQNQIGDTKTNSADAVYFNPGTSSDTTMPGGSQTITIAEPRIATTKSVLPVSGVQAGDTLTYNVSFTNTGNSTAYDVTVQDVLAQGVSYNAGSASCLFNAVPVTVAVTDNGSSLDFASVPAGSWDIAPGGSITCAYTVTADADVHLDGSHTNTIDADWTGLDGVDPNERTYNDTVDRLVDGTQDTASASFTTTGINFSKSVDKSSATIGEVVTYTLTITGPNGMLRSMSITDNLDAGWIFNNDTVYSGLSVHPVPTFGTNDGSVPVTVTWNFGDVEKSTEPATLTYSVTVADESATVSGDTLGNAARLNYTRADGSSAAPLTSNTSTGIIEPDLNLVKTIAAPPSNSVGSPVSYSLQLSHTAASTADAYDVVITDNLPAAYLDFTATNNTNLTITFTPLACGTAVNNSSSATDTVSISVAHLPVGCQMQVDFSAVLKQEITPGLSVTNSAGVGYSTLPGTPPEERSYTDTDSVSFTTNNPGVAKELDSSNATQTTDPNLTIGETATYKITVHLPEGTTNTLQVIDTLPATLAYVSGSAVVAAATDRTGTAIPAPVISEDGVNHRVTFDFTGPIVITDADPATVDDTFTITLQAVVLNHINNQSGVTLTNTVTVQADGGAVLSDSADITLVEPDLNITKTANNTAPTPEEEITFTLDLAHTAASNSDAFDVAIEDTIPAGLDFVTGSATMPAGWSFALNGNVVTFSGSLPLLTGNAQFTYKAVVNNATPIGTNLTNTAVTAWTSMPGTAAEERNGNDWPGGLNDYGDQDVETITFHSVELVLAKDGSPATISPSTPTLPSVLRYTINYSNVGNLDATNVVVTETVPQFTRFNKTTSTGGNTLPPTGWDCADLAAAGSTCHFSFALLPAGGSGTLYFDVVIDESVPANTTQIHNTASIRADQKEPNYTNNSDNENTPLAAAPDMAISKTDGVNIVSPGIELTYTLTVRNNGNEGATGVVLTDTLPYHVTYVSGSASPAFTSMGTVPAPPDPDQTVLTWQIPGEVAAGAELTFTFRVLVEDPMPAGVTQIVNIAHVTDDGTNGADPTPADNDTSDTDFLATLPNTNFTKIVAGTSEPSTVPPEVAIGEMLTYRITFVLPPGNLPNMTLTDTLPLGLAFGNCLSIIPSSAQVTSSLPNQFATTCYTPAITAEPAASTEPANQARHVVFDFGDVTNASSTDETLTLEYNVYVLDNAANVRGVSLVNQAIWQWGTNNNLQAVSTPVTIVEPTLSLYKSVTPTSGLVDTVVTYTLTLAHTAASNATAFDVLVQDTLPSGMTYLFGSLQVISGPAPDLLDGTAAPLLRIGWDVLPVRDSSNNLTTVVIQYKARINTLANEGDTLTNSANAVWSSLPGDVSYPQTPNNLLSTERFYDPGDAVNIYGANARAVFTIPRLDKTPATGFAPGVITDISGTPKTPEHDLGGITLDIPSLRLKLPVVGIPATLDGWDLTWLGAKAGWLEGTAYPTWQGNTAITAHVYLPNGNPGPFVNLKNLRWGERFHILMNGMRYTYEVRIVARVRPNDETVLAHERLDWVTLITCAGYDQASDSYKWRDVVKAVLISVESQ